MRGDVIIEYGEDEEGKIGTARKKREEGESVIG